MDTIPERVEGYRLYSGHWFASVIRRFVAPDAVTLTAVRHPVARTISHYYQMVRYKQSHPDDFPNLPPTLEAAVFDPVFCVELMNLQTRLLGSDVTFDDFDSLQAARQAEAQAQLAGHGTPAEAAFAAIDSAAVIGVTERFAETMALLSYTFGWPPMANVEAMNIGSYREKTDPPPPHVVERIIELNREDQKLYDYTLSRFQERIDAMLRELTRRNDMVYRMSTTPQRREITVTFDRMTPASFYPPRLLPTGRTVIYSGPDRRSTLELAIAPGSDLALRFCVVDAITPAVLDSLCVSVNGHDVMLTRTPAPGGAYEFEGIVPKAAIPEDRYFSELAFEVSQTHVLNEIRTNSGERIRIGFALEWLRIEPQQERSDPPPSATLPAGAARARIEAVQTVARVKPLSHATIRVCVRHTGSAVWPAHDSSGLAAAVRLGGRWASESGQLLDHDESRTDLPRDVSPGDTEMLDLILTAPAAPGRYRVLVNMLHEHVAWFDSPALVLVVDVAG